MIRSLILLGIIGLFLVIAPTAWAGGGDPCDIADHLTIPDYQTWAGGGADSGPAAVLYRGENIAGNHVVIMCWPNSGTQTLVRTYEISPTGSISGVIDTELIDSRSYDQIHLARLNETSDWVLISKYNLGSADFASIRVTSEGGISEVQDTANLAAIVYDLSTGAGNYILASVYGAKTYTITILSDGEIVFADNWDYGLTGNKDLMAVPTWQDGTDRGYIVGQGIGHYWRSGTYSISNGDIATVWAATQAWTYIGASNLSGDTCWLGDIDGNNDLYVSAYGASSGHGGDPDIGVEVFQYDYPAHLVSTGTGYLYDASSGDVHQVVNIAPGVAAVFYRVGVNNYLSMLYGIDDTGSVSQECISAGTRVGTPDYVTGAVCQLGDTNYVAFTCMDTPDIDLYVLETKYPPVVTTDSLVERGHNEGDAPPLLFGEGSVQDIGSSDVFECGFVYNKIGYPTCSGSKISFTETATAPFTFSGTITDNLRFDQPYFVRAYACNQSGTGYGRQLTTYTHPLYSDLILDLEFEPLHISSGTISDQSGYGHDFSYTLAANPAGLDTTIGDIVPTDLAEYTCTGTDCQHFFDAQFIDPEGYIINPGSSNVPSVDFLPENTVPARLFWLSGLTILFCALGFCVYRYTRVLLVTAVIGLLCIFWACYQGWMGWWVFVMCVILTPGLLLKDESRQPF